MNSGLTGESHAFDSVMHPDLHECKHLPSPMLKASLDNKNHMLITIRPECNLHVDIVALIASTLLFRFKKRELSDKSICGLLRSQQVCAPECQSIHVQFLCEYKPKWQMFKC